MLRAPHWLSVSVSVLLTTAGSALASEAYLANWSPPNIDNSLHRWNIGTATTTRIGSTGLPSGIAGLAWDASSNTMYGIDRIDSQLSTIDLTTGLATVIADTNMPAAYGLAMSPTGVLYGMGGFAATQLLYSIDTATGASTPIGAPNGRLINALTFTPDGRLIGSLMGPGGGGLYEIDTLTGVQTLIYDCPSLSGIAFDPDDGQMYGIDLFTRNAYRIDFATGQFTTLGQFNPSLTLNPQALVFIPTPATATFMLIGATIAARRRRASFNGERS